MLPTPRLRSLIYILCLSLLLSGCTSWSQISLGELQRLDGFESPDMHVLQTTDGGQVLFSRRSLLVLYSAGYPPLRGHFRSIRIEGMDLIGTSYHGRVTRIDLSRVTEAYVLNSRRGMKIALPIVLGVVGLIALFVFVIWSEYQSYSDDDC